jgi:uroporphyrinogen III methyltransferase/synthase
MPKLGKRVLITRSSLRSESIVQCLGALGIDTLVAATTRIVPVIGAPRDALYQALLATSDYDWLLVTSANTVHACEKLLGDGGQSMGYLSELKIATIGEASAEALVSCGLSDSISAQASTGADLARRLMESQSATKGRAMPRILFPRAKHGRDDALGILQSAGAQIDMYDAYGSEVVAASDPAWLEARRALDSGGLQGAAFFAPSQLSALLDLYPPAIDRLRAMEVIAAIGPTTAAALQAVGLEANAVADQPSSPDLADKILQAFS